MLEWIAEYSTKVHQTSLPTTVISDSSWKELQAFQCQMGYIVPPACSGSFVGCFPILISHFVMPLRPFKVRITVPMLKSRQLAFYNIKNKNHVKICFKVCRVEFGLVLMFQAFQEEYIRLLMTIIQIHRKKTALHVSYICTCIYSLTKETKQKIHHVNVKAKLWSLQY